MALKDRQVLILGICEYVTSYGKRDFADVIKFRFLRLGDHLGLSRWTLDVITKVFVRRRQREI